MSEHRRRSPNGGGQPPGGHGDGRRPYPPGNPPQGAPSRGRPGQDELRADGIRRSRATARETAQQPRLTRAEMRRQAQKGGGGGGAGGRRGGPPVGGPGKKRFVDYPRWGKSGFRRWIPSWKQVLTLFLVFFGGTVAAVGVAFALTPVPDANKQFDEQNNIYFWADGSEMTRKGTTNRQVVPLSDISRAAQDTTIAAENETFRTDKGIDPKGIARAVYKMATGGETQGGSTITQQYVKNYYLSKDQTVTRKVKELFITLKIADQKDEVLKGYLNTSWYGRNSIGVQAAAQAYYGKDASQIDICQGAMLAGLLKGAGLYDPSLTPENHKRMQERWEYVLNRMVVANLASQADVDKCGKAFPEPIKPKAQSNMTGEISYLVETANKYLMAKDPTISDNDLQRGGYKIYTTFEKTKVDALKNAVDGFQKDNLHPDKRDKDKFVQMGAASVVPNDGAIVAIYGGEGIENGHYTNNADAPGIPVGSTFKPFVLATAMQTGVLTKMDDDGKPTRISTDSRYMANNLTEIFKPDGSPAIGDNGQPYRQRNDSTSAPGYVTLKEAMKNSYNVPFVQLNQDVGGKNVEAMVLRMGLRPTSLAPSSTITFPLGTSTPSAIRMASAYSVFAAHGQQTDPYSVKRVTKDGVEQPLFTKPTAKKVLDPAVADNITDVLENVAKNGTGKKTNELGFPVAGKTGTTDAGTSAWWVGYTNSLVTSVGMWREEPGKPGLLSLDGTAGKTEIHGGDFPTDVFTRYMKVIGPGNPRNFPDPEDAGVKVDASGAPSTASPSASASASTSASPTESPSTTPSPTSGPTGSPSPSASASCFLLCPTRTPPTRPGKPSPTATDTSTQGGGPGGGGLPGQ
ncbi:transglycosylase domain-containing protein [Streptomyces sp. NRRL B-24484]|uniref:transglycosylase domain-containing protein n=1 Tax=Streptomyces sp. NRRL B-24484 TaxID=1463833 RepID=UPI0004BFE738|nr:transglycosylase domain-containing protein [Streptomyces sp. NRRL B-24484]